jgi:hypothetical protein
MLKYKIRIPKTNELNINIPITMENQMVDQSEIIQRKFVETEVEKSINPIFDYERAKFAPHKNGGVPVKRLNYNVSLLAGNNYADVGFNDNDLAARTNAFRNTFLRLNFYDTDRLSDQRLLFFITLFTSIYDIETTNGGDIDASGNTINADQKEIKYKIISEKEDGRFPKEGFNIFYFSDEVNNAGLQKEVYMKAEFLNAKTGSVTNLMTSSNVVGIEDVVNQLHTRYLLKKDNTRGYHYVLDDSQSNVSYNGNRIDIDLYEVDVL